MDWGAWLWRDGAPVWPNVLLLGLLGAVVITGGVAGASSTTVFGPYNPSWDGASDLRSELDTQSGLDTEFVSESSRYESLNATNTVAFIIAPDDQYDDASAARVREFVAAGGRLVVMENFGTAGNDLLAQIGAEARLNGLLLRDEQNYFEAPTLPIATGITNHSLTRGVEQLTLNFATVVAPGNATTLVRTSEFAYLATAADDELDDEDELAAYPVVTVEPLGTGQVVVAGDPSLTINAMLDQPDNSAFVAALTADADRVVFDLTHSDGLPPLTQVLLVLRGSPLLQALGGGVLIGATALLSRHRLRTQLRALRQRLPGQTSSPPATAGLSPEQQAAYLRRQHPDWDEQRIQRVIEAINTRDRKTEGEIDE